MQEEGFKDGCPQGVAEEQRRGTERVDGKCGEEHETGEGSKERKSGEVTRRESREERRG